MTTLYLDTETRSRVPITAGTYRYADDADVIIVSFAVDDGPVKVRDITERRTGLAEVHLLAHEADEIVAHNAAFDRAVLRPYLYDVPLEKWRCSMVRAYAHSLPGNLADLGVVLGLSAEDQKDGEGKRLVQLFCQPRRDGSWADRTTHPEEWARFLHYAGQDIVAMRKIWAKLPSWNYPAHTGELALWHLDQRINVRGFAVDVPFAEAAVAVAAEERARLNEKTSDATEGALDSTNQRDALLTHILQEYGVTLPDMQKGTLEKRIADESLPEPVRELLRTRLMASMNAPAKFKTLLGSVSKDGRLRGTLQFCGAARTGRWSGRIFQPQNLSRVPKYLSKQYDFAVECIKSNSIDLFFDNVMQVLGATVRGAIIAPPGRKLVVADLSNIEGRVLAWLAGETWKVEAFRSGIDLYTVGYSRAFGVPEATVVEDTEAGGTMRLLGKVAELACGYQGAVGAFANMGQVYGVTLPEERALEVVKAWRKANSKIVALWYGLEDAVRAAILSPGTVFTVGRLRVKRAGAWLRIALPSGRSLCYPAPEVNDGSISYLGTNQYTRKWERIATYGGKLVENVTQAVARDVFAANLPAMESEGYAPVLLVHDEAVTETPDEDRYTADGLVEIMTRLPAWAEGLPLAAAGFECKRYRKG